MRIHINKQILNILYVLKYSQYYYIKKWTDILGYGGRDIVVVGGLYIPHNPRGRGGIQIWRAVYPHINYSKYINK